MVLEEQGRIKRCRTDDRPTAESCSSPFRASILDLPGELLHKILGSEHMDIARWSALASVCKSWKDTLRNLVPAEVVLRRDVHVHLVKLCTAKIGSLIVTNAVILDPYGVQRLLQCITTQKLHSLAIQQNLRHIYGSIGPCLAGLSRLHTLDLRFPLDCLAAFCRAPPPNLKDVTLELSIMLFSDMTDTISRLQNLASLTDLQVLKVSLINSMIMKPAKAKLVEQRVLLKQLVNAAQSLLAAPRQHHPPLTLPFLSLGPCKSELQAAAAQCKKSALVSSKRKAAKARDGQTSRSTGSQRRQDSIEQECRISKIVELLTEVVAKLDANSSPTSLTGIDGVHLLLQTLQWQLGLAMALDSIEPAKGKLVKGIEALWEAADIGKGWLDLRPLTSLQSLTMSGISALWLPRHLRSLTVECQGIIGPLPSCLKKYLAHYTVSLATTQWDLRPLGFLPLKTLSVSITSLEGRHSRELCFQILQGTHSLQLHNSLESLVLMTDRGLRIDAANSDRLLSYLAQKKELKDLTIGSGYYRLQSLQGDSHSGRGIAALNLLSDLKDHCGWCVTQQERRTEGLLATICLPPSEEDRPFVCLDEKPDFESDFH